MTVVIIIHTYVRTSIVEWILTFHTMLDSDLHSSVHASGHIKLYRDSVLL